MSDYIKREDAINTIHATFTGITADTLELRIKGIPPADVAPVVRCKDCKYYTIPTKPYKSTTPYCLRKAKTKMQSDGFCSCGERKDNE